MLLSEGAEVVDEPPASVLLWDNTNARVTKVAVWGCAIWASHPVFSNLFLEGLVYYLWVFVCRYEVGCSETCVRTLIANVEAMRQGLY